MSRKTMAEARGIVLGWGPKMGEDAPFLQRLWPAVLASAGEGNGLSIGAPILEHLLSNCARDCLNSRKRRDELSAALTPMIEASDDSAEAAAALARAALEYHDTHFHSNGGVCKLGKFHNILYVVVSVVVEQEVQDSDTVTQLLQTLHRCEGGLDRLVAPALLGPKVSHLLSSWRSDTDSAEEARHHLQFFVDHARTTRLLLPQPKGQAMRMLDAPLVTLHGAPPLYVAVQAEDEDAVLLLLQNGAKPAIGGELCPFLLALRRLSSHARATMGQREPCLCPTTLCPCFYEHPIHFPLETVGVFKLILRAMGRRRIEHDPEILHPRLITDGLLGGPPSLRHWARLSIRNCLLKNWSLPHGTRMLGLPEAVVRYLDLYCD
ncbi:uncharacterized protein LOC134783366 [Penaeus indicus]|uniref:uncharacterized protein LOC134783366 n=1 Tax=Penaeus indicus TaxID=29960 RepID=UPI00300D2148